MKIKNNYERTQVMAGYQNTERSLIEARSQVTGAVSRTNFGGSGSQEAHQVFKEVDRLLRDATRKLKSIEDLI